MRRPAEPALTWQRPDRIAATLGLAFVAGLLLVRLSAFGIWDPWELEAADAARRLSEGEAGGVQPLSAWLVAGSFSLLGVSEWTGRLPIALSGLATAAMALWLGSRFLGPRLGVYALLITGTTPLFLFNARPMLGLSPDFALQTAIATSGLFAAFAPDPPPRVTGRRLAALALFVGLTLAGIFAGGALMCALPPVAALAAVCAVDGRLSARRDDPAGALVAHVAWGLTLVMGMLIAHDVLADRAGHSYWLGGQPRPGNPPSFDTVIERVFHAFAPWSALLPLALARSAMPPGDMAAGQAAGRDDARLRWFCALWVALGYGAQTLFLSRYGSAVGFLPVVALSLLVATFLGDLERLGGRAWPAAIAAALLGFLIVRDFSLYPEAPIHGMALAEFTVPKVFNPKRTWAVVIGIFIGLSVVSLAVAGERTPLSPKAPYRFLVTQWKRGLGFKVWLTGAALLMLLLFVFGAAAWISPGGLGLSTQAAKWARRGLLVPLGLPVAAFALQALFSFAGRLDRTRMWPLMLSGCMVGAYASQGFMPALSAHYSPREIYETYNALAGDDEPLAEYKVGGRAAAYYAKGEVRDVTRLPDLIEHLTQDGRRWAAFPSDELANVDRMFRRESGRHLFVADARSARVVLAANRDVKGRKNESFLVNNVLKTVPDIQHPVRANMDGRIEFLGYALELPHDGHVAAGESFHVTWYFRSLKTVPGNYRMFVHIDGHGQRIHGDHHPIDEKYPARLWDEGDVIVDRQRLEVPSTFRSGNYTIFLGFYSGDERLAVKSGPHDGDDRIKAGVLRIR